MLSACVGSLINLVVITPFDVVRIRLQQQELLSQEKAVLLPRGCCRTQPAVFWLLPVDCSHPCAQIEPATARLTGTWQSLKFIALNEGVASLWKGISLALVIAIPANVVYYAGYDHLKDRLPLGAGSPLVAGAFARTVAVVSVAPIELVKTRLQAMPTMKLFGSSPLLGLLKDTRRAVQTHGIGSLFKGLELTLFRDVPFSSIYWASYELCKKHFTPLFAQYSNSQHDLAFMSLLSGSISGTIAAICTNPFDVGKTRLQVSAEPEVVRNTLVKKPRKVSMVLYLTQIARTEGIGALYVGLVPRVLKIAPSCAVMVSTYEVSKKFFHERSVSMSKPLS